MHKSIGAKQQEKNICKVKYFTKLQKLVYIFIDGQNQKKQTEGISNPAETPVSNVTFLASGKHIKIGKGHQKSQDNKCKDHARQIQMTTFFKCLICITSL